MLLTATLAALTNAATPAPPLSPALPEAPAPAPQEGEGEDSGWKGSVNVGFNTASGNTKTTATSISADAEMRDGDNRYTGYLYYNYSQDRASGPNNDQTETIQDNRGLWLEYDRFVDERLYLFASGNADTDEVRDMQLRTAIGGGAGYQIFDTEELSLNGKLGLSFVDEDYRDDSADTDYTAARVSTGVAWQANEDLRVEHSFNYLQSLDESEDYFMVSNLKGSTSLGESMVASLQYVIDYDNTPAPTFQRDDHRVILSVGWTF